MFLLKFCEFKNDTSGFLLLQMEFSFGTHKWLPRESLHDRPNGSGNYALGLHAPGFFDKVLNVDKCLLQIDPANKVRTFVLFLGINSVDS